MNIKSFRSAGAYLYTRNTPATWSLARLFAASVLTCLMGLSMGCSQDSPDIPMAPDGAVPDQWASVDGMTTGSDDASSPSPSGDADTPLDAAELDAQHPDMAIDDVGPPDAAVDQFVAVDQGCQPEAETCNGQDDDCNGVIDDVQSLGGECSVGVGACRREGTLRCDLASGELTCSVTAGPEEAEACNGTDDDCDGRVDELNPGGQAECETERSGRCREGRTQCREGMVVCESLREAELEVCDGLDNDCNGAVDDLPPAGACDTGVLGICAAGTVRCTDGELACIQDNEPADELCDGLDNDCNGRIDDGPIDVGEDCRTNRPGACRAGRSTCVEGRTLCVSLRANDPERCDGDDQDCDGRIDENIPGVGEACDPGWATPDCRRRAVLVCENGWQSCQPDDPPADPCNGIDDDCDGRIGEDLLGMACEVGAPGQCNIGGSLCEGNMPVCIPAFEPDCEIDNGLDDDCDGRTDEAPARFCAPRETQLSRFCLDDNNRIAGFDMVVDPYGEIWAVRATINNGTIYLSRVAHDGTEVREQVYGRTAVSGISPMVDAAITLHESRPAVCFWKATSRTLFAAIRTANGQWVAEEIIDRNVSGEDCDIASVNGQLVVAYRDQGALWAARRIGPGQWQRNVIDEPAGSEVGVGLDLEVHQGVMVIAHQDGSLQQLRLTYETNGRWRTTVIPADLPQGYRPTVQVTDGWIYVLHGERPQAPDIGGDSAIYFTELSRLDPNEISTTLIGGASVGGGQALMVYGDGLLGFLRNRLRDAVFGDQDKLTLRRLVQGQLVSDLEVHGLAERRRTFKRLALRSDPFGLPVAGFSDEGAPVNNDRGFGKICFYRPNDLDGDHLPDVVEIDLGTNPERADTDNDGRSDGQEVLRDGTDPLRR